MSRKKKLLEKQKKGNVGGSENSVGRCFPDYTDAGIWQCAHSAGSVYRGVADGRGVTDSSAEALAQVDGRGVRGQKA